VADYCETLYIRYLTGRYSKSAIFNYADSSADYTISNCGTINEKKNIENMLEKV
jgi:hypothetical protein